MGGERSRVRTQFYFDGFPGAGRTCIRYSNKGYSPMGKEKNSC